MNLHSKDSDAAKAKFEKIRKFMDGEIEKVIELDTQMIGTIENFQMAFDAQAKAMIFDFKYGLDAGTAKDLWDKMRAVVDEIDRAKWFKVKPWGACRADWGLAFPTN